MKPQCPYCASANYKFSYLPDTFFNGKNFKYLRCRDCKLIFVNPFPAPDDFKAIYPISYQKGVNHLIVENPFAPESRKRFSYGKNFDLISKFSKGKKILDYGCGGANFLLNARHNGFNCDGTEYNPEHVAILRKEIPGSRFFQVDEFFQEREAKYDVIRLSNVLEHLTNPSEVICQLVQRLNPEGIMLVEGPLETNPTLALRFRQGYFKLKKFLFGTSVNHAPTHIVFANVENQKMFFKKLKLKELYFDLTETAWPYPGKLNEINGTGSLLKYVIAKASIAIKPLNKNWGNSFIYIGKPA